MRGLVLGNIDYRRHMTDEGEQLQAGLVAAGWDIAGFGYGDGCPDVPTLLERYRPDVVFVQDVRDWYRGSGYSYDPQTHFERSEALADWPGRVVTVLKDAGTTPQMHRDWIAQVRPDALVVYYHPDAVRRAAPWLQIVCPDVPLIRTYHSIDRTLVDALPPPAPTRYAAVSGAVSHVYPLRTRVVTGNMPGMTVLPHPGYGNQGTASHTYLATLADFRVHVATASCFDFALRKIIETAAVGTTPVTDLSTADRLPEIDDALVRVPSGIGCDELQAIVAAAAARWTPESAQVLRSATCEWYDYRAVGARLSAALLAEEPCVLLAS